VPPRAGQCGSGWITMHKACCPARVTHPIGVCKDTTSDPVHGGPRAALGAELRAAAARPALTLKPALPLPQGELDELEREEFFRLKKVQANKRKVADEVAARVRARSPARLRRPRAVRFRRGLQRACIGAASRPARAQLSGRQVRSLPAALLGRLAVLQWAAARRAASGARSSAPRARSVRTRTGRRPTAIARTS